MQLSRVTTLFIASSLLLYAQSEIGSASLSGTVTDPSNALVTGAKITVANVATGLTRSLTTTGAGFFNFVRLPVGNYSVEVQQTGFTPLRIESLPLTVGGQTNLDLKLQVTSASTSMNITTDLPLVETTRAHTATAVNEKAATSASAANAVPRIPYSSTAATRITCSSANLRVAPAPATRTRFRRTRCRSSR